MTAVPMGMAPRSRPVLMLFVIMLVSLLPLYGLVQRVVPTDHADGRHGGERYTPKAIRACLANLVMDKVAPFQYELPGGNRIAVICRLDFNRYGVQFNFATQESNGVIVYNEITTFYSTLSRVKNILLRDGYAPVVKLPEAP